MKPDIVYITGRGHCGTTVLDLSLSAHKDLVGVGEVMHFLKTRKTHEDVKAFFDRKNASKRPLSPYWNEFRKVLEKNIELSLAERYRLHYDFFRKKFPGKIMVDPSKNIDDFFTVKDMMEDVNRLPIFLLKDVRNDAFSMLQKKKKKSYVRSFLEWYYVNKKILRRLDGIEHLKFGYEEFAHNPEHVLKMICEKIGVDYDEKMLDPSDSNSIAVSGNGMLAKRWRQVRIFYDYRWMESFWLNIVASMFPFIMSFNRKHVYSNQLMDKLYYRKR
ncbi:MAG: hypothetical protein ACLFNK_05340 [Candidatus Woesearchaeota archaeon]